MHARLIRTTLVGLLVATASCAEDGTNGAAGTQGEPGEPGTPGERGPKGDRGERGESFPATLLNTTIEPSGEKCAGGGVRIDIGEDDNESGVLDPAEIDLARSRWICNGAAGQPGVQGEQGAPGSVGPAGPQGATGASALVLTTAEPPGATCPTGGVKLEHGADANFDGILDPTEIDPALTQLVCNGEVGPMGPIGPQGIQGPQGEAGPQGPQGVEGPMGPEGPQGPQGIAGPQGPQGVEGPMGPEGPQGPQGVAGPQGPQGDVGPAGPQGATGPAGPIGPEGPQGDEGPMGTGSGDVYGHGTIDLQITGNVNWVTTPPADANTDFANVHIHAGATLTVPSGTVIRTQQFLNEGTIVVAPAAPGTPGRAPTRGLALTAADSPAGGDGLTALGAAPLLRPGALAGGAGSPKGDAPGGSGGGSLVIRSLNGITNSGLITADGGAGTMLAGMPGTGGGAGGMIVLLTRGTIFNTGTLRARGGNGGSAGGVSDGGGGGGGGGGIVHLLGPAATSAAGTIDVAGGAAGSANGVGRIAGGGGGALGGNGGRGGDSDEAQPAAAGSTGLALRTNHALPDALLF